MRLRSLDATDRRAYLDEIRPRFFVLCLRAGRVNLRWGVPSWALEEPVRFAMLVAPLLVRLAPALGRRLPSLARLLPGGVVAAAAPASGAGRPLPGWWYDVDALFSEAHRDLLALPEGAPLVDIDAGRDGRKVRVLIEERRLGPADWRIP